MVGRVTHVVDGRRERESERENERKKKTNEGLPLIYIKSDEETFA